MTAPATILWIPPADRPDVLASSVGGGLVPSRVLAKSEITNEQAWVETVGQFWDPIGARALLLSLAGVPDPIGMGRAALTLATHDGAGCVVFAAWRHGDQNIAAGTGRWWLEWYEVSAGDKGFAGGATFGSNRSYGDYGADRLVDLKRPNDIGDGFTLDAWALATILTARIGGSVVLA